MLAVQVRERPERKKELTAIPIGSIVGHAHVALGRVRQFRRIVGELAPEGVVLRVDRSTAGAVALVEISQLHAKVGNDPVDHTVAIAEALTVVTVLAQTEAAKVFRSQGRFFVELNADLALGELEKADWTCRLWDSSSNSSSIFLLELTKELLFAALVDGERLIDRG